jgi:hypothetical protein
MRRFLSYSIAFLLVFGATFATPGLVAIAHSQQHCGDHNRSGEVAASDALLLLQFAVGIPVEVSCPTGLHCWDAEDNGVCDEVDDVNEDGYCDILDCQGPMGTTGPMGPSGPMGPNGHSSNDSSELLARVDALEAAVAALQSLHGE